MKCEKYLPTLRSLTSQLASASQQRGSNASRGERIMAALFPNRGTGWPGGWSQDRLEQALHLKNWTGVAIDILASKLASITPNIAYVESGKSGRTVKTCERSLYSLMGKGFGSSGVVGATYDHRTGQVVDNPQWDYGKAWKPNDTASVGISGGGHSWLTVGEWRSKALSVVKPHEELSPLDNDHLLRRLVDNPNPWDTGFAFRYERYMFDLLHGVHYVWEVPNNCGVPVERWVLPGHWVWPRTGGKVPDGGTGKRMREGGRLSSLQYDPGQDVGDHLRWGANYVNPWHPDAQRLIQYYEVRPWGGMGSAGILRLPPNEVTMHVWKSPLNKIDGYSKLSMIAQWIDEEEAISRSRWSQSMNIARPEFWIELGPGYEDPDDDRTARVEAKLLTKFQGEFNYGKPIIGPPGAKFNALSFSPTEMAYFQSEEQIRDMILSAFHIPKSVAGISTDMTYGALLATLAQMCSYGLNPCLASYGETDTKFLASRWDEKYPAWSSNSGKGYGSSGGVRRVRLWYDDCLDQETECLTDKGWKKQEELTEETKVACYDDETGTIVYRQPKRIIRRHHTGEMHLWDGGRVNAAMTPRHRVYVKPQSLKKQRWVFKTAADAIPARGYKVLRAAPAACDVPTPVIIDRYEGKHQQEVPWGGTIDPRLWLEFLGYFLSEGNLTRGNTGSWLVTISQNTDNADFEKMRNCVLSLPLGNWKEYRKYDKRYDTDKYTQFVCTDRGLYEHLITHCGEGSKNKRIPNYLKSWPASDLRILLDALIAGDGRKPKVNANTGVWNSQYTTVSQGLADDVMEIAIKCGLSASITRHEPYKPHQSPYYVVNLSSRVEVLVLPDHCKTVQYDGPVWCVEVPTGKFVVRRNGIAHITGNCVPADPSQVNSDIQTDHQVNAITPDEVRALRGRKPYPNGYGSVPWVQGPGGMAPFPLHEDIDLEPIAEGLKPLSEGGQEDQMQQMMMQQQQLGGPTENASAESDPTQGPPAVTSGNEADGAAEDATAASRLTQPADLADDAAGIEEPNGKPSKSLVELAKAFLAAKEKSA